MKRICRELQETLAGEGIQAVRADVSARRHLEECDDCLSVLEALSRLDGALADLPALDAREGTVRALLARAEQERQAMSASQTLIDETAKARRRTLIWLLPAAAATVLALAVLTPARYLNLPRYLQIRAALKDAHKAYLEEDFKTAASLYERVAELDPGNAAAGFYLASSHQALYRPAQRGKAENDRHLTLAVDGYRRVLELAKGPGEEDATLRRNALAALSAIYADEPYRDYDTAIRYAGQLVEQDPDNVKNLFAMASLHERFGRTDLAEKAYTRAWELHPDSARACGALAAFYNKSLWDASSRFDDAIHVLERCAALDSGDPAGFYKVATFYWDKAYRDPTLDDKQKNAYADEGLAAVEKALALKADYIDAIVYKGLLLRVKAGVTHDRRLAFRLLEEAQALQKLSMDLRREQAERAQTQATTEPTP